MNTKNTIGVEKSRVEGLIDVLAALTTGSYDVEIDIISTEDEFAQVEYAINFLAEQLLYERNENETKQGELSKQLDLIKNQQKAILELSTPSIKVWDGVLVIPIIGTLDTHRSQRLTEELLLKIAETQSKVAIVDITGVPTVDSAVANHLIKTISSVKLLGAECVVTGILPEVAQTIVHLGVDLSDIRTLSNLGEGLKWALRKMHYNVSKDEQY